MLALTVSLSHIDVNKFNMEYILFNIKFIVVILGTIKT